MPIFPLLKPTATPEPPAQNEPPPVTVKGAGNALMVIVPVVVDEQLLFVKV